MPFWFLLVASVNTIALAARPTTLPVTIDFNRTALTLGESAVMAVTVEVPQGYHAQSATPSSPNYIPFKVTLASNPAADLSPPVYPPGEEREYPQLGRLNVYEGKVIVLVPLKVKPDAPLGPLKLEGKLQYQICDDHVCLPPQRPKISAEIDVVATGTPTQANKPELFAPFKATATTLPTSAPAAGSAAPRGENDWTIWTAFGAAFIAGLLFNVMPCVLPVLPLKAAAFHRAGEHSRSRSVMLGTAFSVGIIAVFAVLAILVLVLRVISWGSLFSNPIFVWGIVILLLLCAGGMFGMFTFTLPTALYNVDPRQDTIGGNIVFGAFTAILATPCTAPLLPPLLLWASAQPALIGVPAMLFVGVGMAAPYLILSATPELAKRFPRTGPWSELFKQMMGFLLLASAMYFAGGRLIHGPNFWWLVVAVFAVAALYLIARTVQLSKHARPVAIASTLAVIMLGGPIFWSARITGLTSATGGVSGSWTAYSDDRFNDLRNSGKPVLVKFTANWCATCQYIEGTVFRDPQVWAALKAHDITPIKVDLTDEDAPGKELLLKLNPAGGIPLTAIFAPGRSEPVVLASVYSSSELLHALDQATSSTIARASQR